MDIEEKLKSKSYYFNTKIDLCKYKGYNKEIKELPQNAINFEKTINFRSLQGKARKAYQIRYVDEL